jgi:hypothetical protein
MSLDDAFFLERLDGLAQRTAAVDAVTEIEAAAVPIGWSPGPPLNSRGTR